MRFFPDIWVLVENKNDLCILFEGLWKRGQIVVLWLADQTSGTCIKPVRFAKAKESLGML